MLSSSRDKLSPDQRGWCHYMASLSTSRPAQISAPTSRGSDPLSADRPDGRSSPRSRGSFGSAGRLVRFAFGSMPAAIRARYHPARMTGNTVVPPPPPVGSVGGVVPGDVGEQAVGLLGAPAAPGVLDAPAPRRRAPRRRPARRPRRRPGGRTGSRVPVERRPDQPVVGSHVRAGLCAKTSSCSCGIARAGHLAGQGERAGFGPDAEAQRVRIDGVVDAEGFDAAAVEPDRHLGGGDRHGLSRPDQDRHAGPPPGVGASRSATYVSVGRVRGDASHVEVALVLAADDVLGGQRPKRVDRRATCRRSQGRSRRPAAGRPSRWPAPAACGSARRRGSRRCGRRTGPGRRRRRLRPW